MYIVFINGKKRKVPAVLYNFDDDDKGDTQMIKIGFDISGANIGYAVLIDNDPVLYGSFPFRSGDYRSFGDSVFYGNNEILESVLENIVGIIGSRQGDDVVIALEFASIAKFGNVKTSRVLNFMVGYVLGMLVKDLHGRKAEIKLIDPQEWQRHFDINDGSDSKLKSIENSLILFPEVAVGDDDDLADALNIAFLADLVRDFRVVGIGNRDKAKQSLKKAVLKKDYKARCEDRFELYRS